MTIEDYIAHEVFEQRLDRRVLVVYDPDQRYRGICSGLESDGLVVVDASDSSIESREQALSTLAEFGQGGDKLLVYVPVAPPLTDEDKQRDPFSLYSACGEVFPQGDGDSYLSLCLKAKPDYQSDIRQAFEQAPNPSFAVINSIGGGLQWPTLRTLLKVESSQEIIKALMVPEPIQLAALEDNEAWLTEASQLFKQVLGFSLTTRSKKWQPVSAELWRFVLFSEFVFDLPGALPESLAGVPCAHENAQPVINNICDSLRQDLRKQEDYIHAAEQIERDLDLESLCEQVQDLGERDTFPFEERTFLQLAIQSIESNDIDGLNAIIDHHRNSIWTNRGENLTQWDLVAAAKDLIETCDDLSRQLSDHSANQAVLLDFYLAHLREADRLQREFEQAVADYWDEEGLLRPVIKKARENYRTLAEKVQKLFTLHLTAAGWPPAGRLSNLDTFDKVVAEQLKTSGQRVAYFMVDALRFELGLELEKQLKDEFETKLTPAYACLPSITVIGMAGLLPGASKALSIQNDEGSMVPVLGDTPVKTVPQRMKVFEQRYGSRFAEMRIEDFLDAHHEFESTVELAVLRSVEIDGQFENSPRDAPSVILRELKKLRVAISRLQKQGFNYVVIATDHGFFMNTQAIEGDICPKPAGNWQITHERIALGSGNVDANHFVLSAAEAGVQGDFSQVAGPLSMAAYSKNKLYFHGGASLQECVVPVMEVILKPQSQPAMQQAQVELDYKKGAQTVTTRRPVILISVTSHDLFAQAENFEILLEAQNKAGEVVGEAKIGGPVNAATRTVSLQPGESQKVPLVMDDEFEGAFTVKALNPNTLVEYANIKLKTDYVV